MNINCLQETTRRMTDAGCTESEIAMLPMLIEAYGDTDAILLAGIFIERALRSQLESR